MGLWSRTGSGLALATWNLCRSVFRSRAPSSSRGKLVGRTPISIFRTDKSAQTASIYLASVAKLKSRVTLYCSPLQLSGVTDLALKRGSRHGAGGCEIMAGFRMAVAAGKVSSLRGNHHFFFSHRTHV